MKKILFCLLTLVILKVTQAQPPTINSFLPLSGKPGDVITITGTNFNSTASNNVVFFGAVKATVTTSTVNSLIVTVSVGATYAPITMLNTVTALAASSRLNFNPIFTPPKTNITSTDFEPKQDFTTGSHPFSVAINDLDGDGKSDLIIANSNSSNVSVFRNTSASGSINLGSLTSKVDFTTGDGPISLATGDLDGDGKPDLVVANNNSATISILRNTSMNGIITSSSFASKVDFATNGIPFCVAIGDLDGDGKPDIAVANANTASVSVFRNTSTIGSISSSSFDSKVDFTTGVQPRSLAIGDLDGDGKMDLAVANYNSNNISVLQNTSSSGNLSVGSFAVKVDYTTGNGPYSVVIGDLDGDNKSDLIVANQNSNSISVFRNTSILGTFTSASFSSKVDFTTITDPYTLAIGDLDGDEKPDLAVANRGSNCVSVFRNTISNNNINSSSFASKVDFNTGTFSLPYSVAIGDLDGDGKADLAVANNQSSTISLFRNSDILLPVVITNLKAYPKNNKIQVEWVVANEINLSNYEVEKSSNGVSFRKLGIVTATASSNYQLLDVAPTNGDNYYRIKMVNKDGSFKYSSIVNVKIGSSKNVFTIAGNPITNKQLTLQLENVGKGNYAITVYNNAGQKLLSKNIVHGGGSATETLSLQYLPTGSYQVNIVGSNNINITKTIVVE